VLILIAGLVENSSFLGLTGRIHAGKRLCYFLEERLDVKSSLGTGLDEHDVEFLGFLFALFGAYLSDLVGVTCVRITDLKLTLIPELEIVTPLLSQIGLVSDKHNNNIIPTLGTHIIDPL
jgi:hypothetical protein